MKVIDTQSSESEAGSSFKIGHNLSASETFIPNISRDDQTSTVFVDPAGINSAENDFSDLINALIHRYMFQQAAQVRFLLLITVQSINEDRGADVKK